jgi:hypothetical protein
MSSGAKRAMLSEIEESRMDASKVQPAKTAMAPAVWRITVPSTQSQQREEHQEGPRLASRRAAHLAQWPRQVGVGGSR